MAAAANEILTEWETSLKKYKGNRKNSHDLFPTALQLYKLGLFLHLHSVAGSSSNHQYSDVQRTYHEVIKSLPSSYRTKLFRDLSDALGNVLKQEDDSEENMLSALQSVSQLYDGSSIAAEESFCNTNFDNNWSIERLSLLIACYKKETTGPCILTCFRH